MQPNDVSPHLVAPATASAEPGRVQSTTEVERHGIDPIPDAERTASVLDFMRLEWGGLNSLATAVLGAFPIVLGLSFWQALAATLLGVLIGALVLAPMAIFGPLTGTNNAVASSAHYGVIGRIVGSYQSLLTAVAFFSISVWSCGDAVVGAAHHVFGIETSEWYYAAAYGVFALSVLIVCIYGFQLMLLVNKIAVIAASILFITGFFAFWGAFNPNYAGAGFPWNGMKFWQAFIAAALIALANPISFGAFLGDWSRYVPRNTSKVALMGASTAAQLLSLVPFVFGLMTATVIAEQAPKYLERVDYTGGLLAVAPGWFFFPLFILAVLSGMSTGTTSLYGTGLDFSSVFPRLSRARATLLIGLLAGGLIFLGRFYFNLIDSISAFTSLIVVTTTPWMVVMIIGYFVRRGFYLPDAMQVFNRGMQGGPYWFRSGWNVPGTAAWLISSLLALLTVNIPDHFVGWLGNIAGGVNISIIAALILPAILYPLFLHLFPEPRGVFGPDGPRCAPAIDAPIAPEMPRKRR
jgi:purine-cytosine permease-like protein